MKKIVVIFIIWLINIYVSKTKLPINLDFLLTFKNIDTKDIYFFKLVLSYLLEFIGLLIIFKIIKIKLFDKLVTEKVNKKSFFQILLLVLLTESIFYLLDILFNHKSQEHFDSNLILIFPIFLGPLFEELFYRKLMLDYLGSGGLKIIYTSLLFSLAHLPNNEIIFYAFIFGILLGKIYERFGFLYVFIFHILSNILFIGSINFFLINETYLFKINKLAIALFLILIILMTGFVYYHIFVKRKNEAIEKAY